MVMVTRVDRDSEGNAAWCMHEQGVWHQLRVSHPGT
jgi:hypothetical protein